jgi:error-prone DNA polymerase
MASWSSSGKLDRHQKKLTEGMRKSGLSPEFAQRVFEQIRGFGSYGFPESHAAAFAHLAYVSAYLKRHFPAEFACALLNSQPMGFYSPAVILNDAKRHGIEVRAVDIQRSHWDSSLEGGSSHSTARALRMGLRLVRGLGETVGRRMVQAREEGGPFRSVEALCRRAEIPTRALVPLAAAGALDSLYGRREALWRATGAAQGDGVLFRGVELNEGPVTLPKMTELERLSLDSHYAQAFPGRHPLELVRGALNQKGVLRAADLAKHEPGRVITIAGLVITRQKPETANGTVFATLEDETGHVDVSFSAGAFLRFQDVVRLSPALMVRGRLQADGLARNVSASFARPLDFQGLRTSSHDFH